MTKLPTLAAFLLASATAAAAIPALAAGDDLAARLQETQMAASQENSGALGRPERLEIEHNLDLAASYARLGQTAKEREYLNVARAELGMDTLDDLALPQMPSPAN